MATDERSGIEHRRSDRLNDINYSSHMESASVRQTVAFIPIRLNVFLMFAPPDRNDSLEI